MKKTMVAAIVLMMSLLLFANAVANEAPDAPVSGTCGENVTWSLDTDTGTLTISGSGAMQDFSSASYMPWNYYITLIQTVVIENGVTSIGNEAFWFCDSLTSISIPNSVTSIGRNAFYCCESLTSIYIPNSVTSIGTSAFDCCSSLTSVTIPSSVTSIGYGTFSNCDSLTSVTIPSGVTSIGYEAFGYCDSLTSVTIPNSVTSIDDMAFGYCLNLTGIHVDSGNADYMDVNGVLFDKSKVTLISYPAGLAGEYTIPEGVTSIGASAFYSCIHLTGVTIPSSVTSIGYSAFGYCDSLTSVTIPSSVTSIGAMAFGYCHNLTGIHVENGNADYMDVNGVLFNKSKTALIAYPAGLSGEYTIPDSVTNVSDAAFADCSKLTSVTIPASVTSIGYYAFDSCSSLTNVTIPASVTSIVGGVFWGCDVLTDVYYGGTALQWSAVKIGYDNYALTNATIHYTENGSVIEGTCGDNVAWTLDPNTGVLTISGSGPMNYDWDNQPWRNCLRIIQTVVIENGVTSIGSYAFSGCNILTSVTIPSGVTSIGDNAFNNCDSLTGVTIPSGVTSIGDYAFNDCDSLTSVTIPSSVTSIGAMAFGYCHNLTGIHVDSGNADYADVNGVLFNKSKTTLIAYPAGLSGEYTIPDSVTNVSDAAFDDCRKLTSVTIPNSVTSIGDSTFNRCSGLTSVTIPNSVTSIGNRAFVNCNNLTDVYYGGNALQWSAVEIGYSNYTLTNAAIHYTGNGSVIEGTCGENVTWTLDPNTCVLTISGSGPMTNYSRDNQPWRDYLRIIQTAVIENGVTSIGGYAFYGCNTLTSFTLSSSVTSIGNYAFSGCFGLTSVTIPNSVTSIGNSAFNGCSRLTSVTIPGSVTTIGNDAFSYCYGLTSVTIPSGVTSIGDYAFYDCNSLTSVTIPNSVTSIGNVVFFSCDNLTSIHVDSGNADYADVNGVLFNKSKTTLIAYPAGLYGEYAIPEGVTSIGEHAFDGCNMSSVTMPSSVTSISNDVFWNCHNLISVTIPSGVTSIGEMLFVNCVNLTGIHVNSGNANYTDENGVLFNKSKTTLIAYPAGLAGEYTIPDSVTSIGDYAFDSCYRLTNVTIPSSLTTIGNAAFSGCSGLTSVTIPSTVTSIGYETFSRCSSLTSVTIPSSVTSIGFMAFNNCNSLTSVTIPASVTSIGNNAFYGCNSLADVYYSGTAIQWSAMAIDDGNDALTNANIHYGSQIPDLSELNVLYLPASLQSIEEEAFMNLPCQAVIIPDGCNSIGNRAFKDCFNLVYVRIPASVTTIADDAFDGCSDGLFIDRRTE